jgi:signal transduction histidine kinase
VNPAGDEIMGDRVPHQLETIQRSRLERLLEISTTISSTLDIKNLLDIVLHAVTDLTGCEASSILFLDAVNGHLYFAAASGPNPPNDDIIVPADDSIAGWVLRNARPLILDDVKGDERYFADIDKLTDFETRNLAAVPLLTKREAIGALEAINKHDSAGFDDQDLAMLQALAAQVSVSIENVRLFQQTDLIAEFMHELKTPLMALTAASEILAKGNNGLTTKQRELLEMIEGETAHLSQMAQEFLDLARLESGRTHFVHENIDLPTLVADIVRLQEPQATARNIKIRTIIPADLPSINGDSSRIKQVLLNLTNNAIKYNKDNGLVTIELKALNGGVAIEVADTGPGIPPENLPHLFERFYRVPDAEGFTEGTGLGLTIAQRIVEEHGGRIEVKSVMGEGSSFYCYLPAAR